MTKCPEGFYCPEETGHPDSYPCPIGTYGPLTATAAGLTSSDGCEPCPATYFCPRKGMKLSEVTDASKKYKCKDGYICNEGSSSETGSTLCPVDHWCVEGVATPCALGSYSRVEGLVSQDECILCPPGMVCPNDGGNNRNGHE